MKFQPLIIIVFLTIGFSLCHAQEGGYINKLSVTKGETVTFHISTQLPTVDIDIYRRGLYPQKVTTIKSVPGGIQETPVEAYRVGCGWKPSATFIIPKTWHSGVYEATFPSSEGLKKIIFVVKEKELGSYSKTVVCLTVNTWQAYNNWGGKSLYDYNSSESIRETKVSFDRPFSDSTLVLYYRWTEKLMDWLEYVKTPVEFCTNLDLDQDPSFLTHYNIYVTVGHDEYWSRPERNACQGLVDRGGRMIVLSGNTCWWQVRLEDDFHSLVCYRYFSLDPMYNDHRDSLITMNWCKAPLNDPENKLLGTSFVNGGYVNSSDSVFPASEGYGIYTAVHTNNWIFNGTDLREGETIGKKTPIVGYETDGAMLEWNLDGDLFASGIDSSPTNFCALGISPAADKTGAQVGEATMGFYTTPNGGAVFNAAATDWVYGLAAGDPDVLKITYNVFNYFRNNRPLPPTITSFAPYTLTRDSINHQNIYLKHAAIDLKMATRDSFVVHASDPLGKPLFYRWVYGPKVISTDSFAILTPSDKAFLKTVGYLSVWISNGSDSVSMQWRLIDSSIRFSSYPPTFPYKKGYSFYYKPTAISTVDERPVCQMITAPAWLDMNSEGEITGKVDTTSGTFPITILATDNRNNLVEQRFILTVEEKSGVHHSEDSISLSTSPNPFHAQTSIALTLDEYSNVTMTITNSTGQPVRQPVLHQWLSFGQHTIAWDGNDNLGTALPAGIYLCTVTVVTASGDQVVRVLKLVKN